MRDFWRKVPTVLAGIKCTLTYCNLATKLFIFIVMYHRNSTGSLMLSCMLFSGRALCGIVKYKYKLAVPLHWFQQDRVWKYSKLLRKLVLYIGCHPSQLRSIMTFSVFEETFRIMPQFTSLLTLSNPL